MSQKSVPQAYIPHVSTETRSGSASSGLSIQAFFWGSVLSLAACLGALHSAFINASWMALNISVPIAFFAFSLFVGLLNPLLVGPPFDEYMSLQHGMDDMDDDDSEDYEDD